MIGSRNTIGLTFVEALAAMLFMALVIPVAVRGVQVASQAASSAERREWAAHLAEARLNTILIEETWREGDTEGDFGYEWPGYRWRLMSQGWSEDTMQQLTLIVEYEFRGGVSEFRLDTLVDDTATDETDETDDSTTL